MAGQFLGWAGGVAAGPTHMCTSHSAPGPLYTCSGGGSRDRAHVPFPLPTSWRPLTPPLRPTETSHPQHTGGIGAPAMQFDASLIDHTLIMSVHDLNGVGTLKSQVPPLRHKWRPVNRVSHPIGNPGRCNDLYGVQKCESSEKAGPGPNIWSRPGPSGKRNNPNLVLQLVFLNEIVIIYSLKGDVTH